MILLDTHIWVWHVQGDIKLPEAHRQFIEKNETSGLGVSVISVWEVAKAVEKGRISFSIPIEEWIGKAIAYPGVGIVDLSPEIIVDSTRLPGQFHNDPSDQLIVATARVMNISLITRDSRILAYQHVNLVRP